MTHYYTIIKGIPALRALFCPNEVGFAPLEGILTSRRRASARRARVTGSGGEEGDWVRLVAQGSQPGEIVGQITCRHASEDPVDGILQDGVMTVDPTEGQNAGTAPGQAAGFLFGGRLDRFDGAMLAGGLFSQLWIGAMAVGAEE